MRGWGRVLLGSYLGAKVSWCALGTKNRMIYHQYVYYFFTCVEHCSALSASYTWSHSNPNKNNVQMLPYLHFQGGN